jgi:ubiquinone biosynthesis protein UbiJ
MTTFTTEDRENASPPHIVDSGASVKTLADYIEQENREGMLRNQLHLLQDKIKELETEAFCLRKQIEQLLSEKW